MELKPNHSEKMIPAEKRADSTDPLEKVLRRVRRTRDIPSISKYISEINQELSEYANHSSASELANIILKDYALTNKLLKLVNSAFYGFVSGKVTTVTRAVVLLGYDNIRLAALSLLLFDHFQKKSSARDLKDAALCSFWCGVIAKEIATIQSMSDPEEAFICALLFQLGKLLVIYHMPKDYEKIKHLMGNQVEDERRAVKQVLGVSYNEVGMAVAQQWNFPDSIFKTMLPLSTEILEDKKKVDPLCVIANFSYALCRIVDTHSLAKRDAAIEKLLARYHNHITVTPKQINALMVSSLEKLFRHADALQFSKEESSFLDRLSGGLNKAPKIAQSPAPDKAEKGRLDDSPAFRLAGDTEIDASTNLIDGDDAVSIIMGGIQEITSAMMGTHDINDIAMMSLEILYRALQCQRAILFIHESRSKVMEARFGYGADIQSLVGRLTIEPGAKGKPDLFSQALKTGKDLIVEDAHAQGLRALIPSWYTNNINAKAFLFMPVAYQKICVGAYYADMGDAGPTVSTLEHKYLAMLRNQLILGIKMGR